MTAACKIDHGEEGIPAFLCRTCHPELNMTEEERKEAIKRERAQAKRDAALASKRREVARLERELGKLANVKPTDKIKCRIKASHERKLSQLRKSLDKQVMLTSKIQTGV